jgi:hypothetical protein
MKFATSKQMVMAFCKIILTFSNQSFNVHDHCNVYTSTIRSVAMTTVMFALCVWRCLSLSLLSIYSFEQDGLNFELHIDPKKTTDLSQVTDKPYHILLYQVHLDMNRVKTLNNLISIQHYMIKFVRVLYYMSTLYLQFLNI